MRRTMGRPDGFLVRKPTKIRMFRSNRRRIVALYRTSERTAEMKRSPQSADNFLLGGGGAKKRILWKVQFSAAVPLGGS